MMNIIFYIILCMIVLLVVVVGYKQYKLRVVHMKKKHQCITRYATLKQSFRTTIELFTVQNLVRRDHVESMCKIVDNYFVDQPLAEKQLEDLENLVNLIAITITREMNMSKNHLDVEWLKRKVIHFNLKLPIKPDDYNRNFYRFRIQRLCDGLNISRAAYIRTQVQKVAA